MGTVDNEPKPDNVTRLDTEKRMRLLAKRAARGVAPKPDTGRSEGNEGTVISIGSNPNFKQDPNVIINHLVDESLRPTVYAWLQRIGDENGESTRAAIANDLAKYLYKNRFPSLSELQREIWGRTPPSV